MTKSKIDQTYANLEQEHRKLDESIEIVKISLGMDYDIYVNEYIEELTKFTFGLEADERAQGSIYDYVQARMKEEGVPEPENLDLLINYVVEHKKVTSGVIFPYSDHYPRHPSQLYEATFEGAVLFLIMLFALSSRYYLINKKNSLGLLSGIFLVFYSIIRIVIEIFREPDSHIGYIFNIFSLGQILCLPMLILGFLLIYRKKQQKSCN